MQTVTGIFRSQPDADRAMGSLRSAGVRPERMTFLTPGSVGKDRGSAAIEENEASADTGAIAELSQGSLFLAAVVPGVGLVSAAGLLGAAILAAAGANIGGSSAQSLENPLSGEVREEEIFVYEDVLRKGRTIMVVLAEHEAAAAALRELLQADGAEDIDAARNQWWTDLRSAEQEHYLTPDKTSDNERFYRLGFEAALHARNRCREFDQVSAEMNSKLEDLQQQNPGVDLEEPFTRGYQRGRDYYQRLCDESRAA